MNQRIGSCSICGGDVFGHRGPWWSVNPPPPDRCMQCNAVAQSDIVKMYPSTNKPNKLADRIKA